MDVSIDERIAEQRAEVKRLEAEVERLRLEAEAEEERIKEPLRREFGEVVRHARQRGHSWPDRRPLFFGTTETGDEGALVEYLAEVFSSTEIGATHSYGVYGATAKADEELREAKKALRRSYKERKWFREIEAR